jgi:hypothetical protein
MPIDANQVVSRAVVPPLLSRRAGGALFGVGLLHLAIVLIGVIASTEEAFADRRLQFAAVSAALALVLSWRVAGGYIVATILGTGVASASLLVSGGMAVHYMITLAQGRGGAEAWMTLLLAAASALALVLLLASIPDGVRAASARRQLASA